MENQHRKISGYRELSQEEIDVINKIKKKAEEVDLLLGIVSQDELAPDMRWNAIAKTHFQQGFMALVRSIAKPETF